MKKRQTPEHFDQRADECRCHRMLHRPGLAESLPRAISFSATRKDNKRTDGGILFRNTRRTNFHARRLIPRPPETRIESKRRRREKANQRNVRMLNVEHKVALYGHNARRHAQNRMVAFANPRFAKALRGGQGSGPIPAGRQFLAFQTQNTNRIGDRDGRQNEVPGQHVEVNEHLESGQRRRLRRIDHLSPRPVPAASVQGGAFSTVGRITAGASRQTIVTERRVRACRGR